MKRSRTARGFALIEFTDDYGAQCSLQMSSSAIEPKVWFGVSEAAPKIMASEAATYGVQTTETCGWVDFPIPDAVELSTRMHLTRQQVADLLPALQHFVETGELPA